MTITAAEPLTVPDTSVAQTADAAPDRLWRRILASNRIVISGGVLLLTLLLCLGTLPWTYFDRATPTRIYYDQQNASAPRHKPAVNEPWLWFGSDLQGRSILGRCLLGGTISLAVGAAAAAISVFLGVTVGLVAGYRGGWIDSLLMRLVDILYGLPYILLVILLKIALERPLSALFSPQTANFAVLFLAIGSVSWLTMARVVR